MFPTPHIRHFKFNYEDVRSYIKADRTARIESHTSLNDFAHGEVIFYFNELNVMLILDTISYTMRVINQNADNALDATDFDFNKFPQSTLEYLDGQGYRFIRITDISDTNSILNIRQAANKQLHAVWDNCDDYNFKLDLFKQYNPTVELYKAVGGRLYVNHNDKLKHIIKIEDEYPECSKELNELFENDLEMSFRIARTKSILSTISLKLMIRMLRSRFEKYPNYNFEVIDYKPYVATIKINKTVLEFYPQGKFKIISTPEYTGDLSIYSDITAVRQLLATCTDEYGTFA